MKKLVLIIAISLLAGVQTKLFAQEQEIEQLLLDIQKLTQLKSILTDMKKGYQIVSGGYNTIKNLSQGNFTLYKVFFDGLMAVSPTVRNYKRVADIISYQLLLVKEYKKAYGRFKQDANFNGGELTYISNVYSNLVSQSLHNLDMLTAVVTANKLRMSDDERLTAIDHIYDDMQDKLTFLRQFNNNTTVLALQRAREKNDVNTIQNIYGVSK